MHRDVILNRLCYDRVKEQTQHYQRLLEVKPTLTMKPPKPHKKSQGELLVVQSGMTKKERMKIDHEVIVQKQNRIMLQKLLEIDHGHSELNKRNMRPVVFKIRSLSAAKGSSHPQIKLNLRSRLEEVRQISQENQIILRKLKDVKPLINHKKLEDDSKQLTNLSYQLSHNAGRVSRHPFFLHENPAATFYRQTITSQSGEKQKILKDYRQFCSTIYKQAPNKHNNSSSILDDIKASLKKKHRKKLRLKKQGSGQNFRYEVNQTANDMFHQSLMNQKNIYLTQNFATERQLPDRYDEQNEFSNLQSIQNQIKPQQQEVLKGNIMEQL